jgi:LysR family hydrogen peroxide-inducible transcriptional activator
MVESVHAKKGLLNGELRVGIIPTLAPYLLPLFVSAFTRQYKEVK